jgi:putative hydrolase of the HAD superfamily
VSLPVNTKNLIFDLGGVILDLSVAHTLQSFSELSGIPTQKVQEIFDTAPGFNEYERGEMDDTAFRDYIREVYRVNATDQQIDTSWNAMLRGLPIAKLNLLKELKKKYTVYLLSNTNEIHLSYINQIMLPRVARENSLDAFFHKAYYSHRMLKRKPEPEIFKQVLEENGLVAGETLFLDDNALNVTGAEGVGIKTVHVTSPDLILDYFHA